MYLSRIAVRQDAQSSLRFWSAFRTAYSLHQAVWDLFGDHPERERDFLYHLKEGGGFPVVFALSARPPVESSELWSVEAKEFAPELRQGTRLGFLLRANPVRTREGKRHDVVMEEKHRLKTEDVPLDQWPSEPELVQEAGSKWLQARAEKTGFRLHAVRADSYRQHHFAKGRASDPVRLSTVDFTGVLEVLDPACFLREALYRGLGPAKGFGCGLVLIRRA